MLFSKLIVDDEDGGVVAFVVVALVVVAVALSSHFFLDATRNLSTGAENLGSKVEWRNLNAVLSFISVSKP